MIKEAEAKKRTENQEPSKNPPAAAASVNPDNVQTLAVDLSPIATMYYGPRSKETIITKDESDDVESILRAPTRRLDSFAKTSPVPEKDAQEVSNPTENETAGDISQPGEQGDGNEADEPIQPRNLASVFDEEARLQNCHAWTGTQPTSFPHACLMWSFAARVCRSSACSIVLCFTPGSHHD